MAPPSGDKPPYPPAERGSSKAGKSEPLLSPPQIAADEQSVGLKATIGLFSGCTIIVGSIIGSGIFVSPKGVQEKAGSVGFSLSIWVAGGLFSAIGAYCYAELGVMIRKSGGDYAYIMEAFGPFVGFVRMWIESIVVRPCSATIVALTFAVYLLRPFFPHCDPPPYTPQLLAALCLTMLTAINCWSVRMATRVQDVFTVAKLAALFMIIITGFVLLFLGYTEHFHNSFAGSSFDVGDIALAFYSSLFAYNGWNYLNFIVEELQNPRRNLPLGILISMCLVTFVYVFTNVAFYTVIGPDEMLESPAVAVSFATKLYGVVAWSMPIFVACSTFGSANGVILTSSRLFYCAAREGHMPELLTMVNPKLETPLPAVLFTGFLSLLYLALSGNLYSLITYVQIVLWLSIGVATMALLWLRYKWPNAERPIKVNLFFPIVFLIGCIFLVAVPIWTAPVDTGVGLLLMFSGVPVYFVFVYWKNKPACFNRFVSSTTALLQKVLVVVPEHHKKDN